MKLFGFILWFELAGGVLAFGQKVMIQGKILDADTEEPIPYVSIVLADLRKGTASNADGEFQFRIDSLPLRVIFSHISYETKELVVRNSEPLTIRMQPRKILMHEVIVEEDRMGDYLNDLVRKAYFHTLQTSHRGHYGKAFYRQISKNGDDYSELYEIFYDTRFNTAGIEDWAIQEGRYALKTVNVADEYIYNKNFTLLFRVLSLVQLQTKDIIQPVNRDVALYYDLKMEHLVEMDGRKVAVVSFKPKAEVTAPAMEGELYIDIDHFDVLRMKGQVRNDQLKFVSLSTKEGSWKNYILSFDMNYKTGPDSTLVLDYITMDQTFDFYFRDVYKNPVKTHGFLFFYEYYHPEGKKHLGGRLVRFNRRDRDILDEMGYNQTFWEGNQVVKRTPVEEEVIKSFEALHAFGSIYLNNRQQLVLEGNELADDAFVINLTKALKNNGYAFMGEKVYLHLDKPFYAAGESIWFSAYLVQASTHLLTSSSGVLYIELLNDRGEIVLRKRILMENGRGNAQMDIPGELEEGAYEVLAFTNWMRNFDHGLFFSKKVNIYSSGATKKQRTSGEERQKDIDLQFFPEGGDLIAGIPAQVAFKAIDPDGVHVDVKGTIYDSTNKKIADFKSSHLGMGTLILSPAGDISYYAILAGDAGKHKYSLPEVRPEGFSMMVNNLKSKGVDLLIKTSPKYHDAVFYLIARMRGVIYHKYKGRFQNRVTRVEIPKSKLPDGVLQITLFDDKGQPHCERLVFINNYQNPVINIRTSGSSFIQGQNSSVWLNLRDQDGKPIRNAALSVSLTSTQWVPYNKYQDNISTHLLLNNDLKGCIENPGYYFADDSRDRQRALDLVMMTHGWRRFSWRDLLEEEKPVFKYHHQQYLSVAGKAVLKSNGKPASNIYLNFIPLSTGLISGVISVSTDASGRFSLSLARLPEGGEFAVNAVNMRNKQIDVKIILDSLKFPDEKGIPSCLPGEIAGRNVTVYLDQLQLNLPSGETKGMEARQAAEAPDLSKRGNSSRRNARVVADFTKEPNNFGSVLQMLQTVVPGLQISGSGNDLQMSLRGSGMVGRNQSPLIVLDGTVIVNPVMVRTSNTGNATTGQGQEQQSRTATGREDRQPQQQATTAMNTLNDQEMSTGPQYSILSSIPVQNIERVEVLKGPSGVGIYGSQGANGVILLYSKRVNGYSSSKDVYKNFEHVVLPGFQFARKFYSPFYQANNIEAQNNFAPTIYWLPDGRTDGRGRIRLTLDWQGLKGQSLRIEAQGLTPYGVPVSGMLLMNIPSEHKQADE